MRLVIVSQVSDRDRARFRGLVDAIASHQDAIDALVVERAELLAKIYRKSGLSYKALSQQLGISAARIGQILATTKEDHEQS